MSESVTDEGGRPGPEATTPGAGPPTVQRIRLVATGLFIVCLFVQFYLAGRGAFGASTYSAHKDFGDGIHLFTVVILVLTLVNRVTRNRVDVIHAVLLLVLFEVQFALADLEHPDVGAFHPVNGLLLLGVSFSLFRRDLDAVRGRGTVSQRAR